MLYYIKKHLGVGEVRVASDGMAEFRLRDKDKLLHHIIPLFDQHQLLTSKYYNYDLFKKALLISNNTLLSRSEKQTLLTALRSQSAKVTTARPDDYISPAWALVDNKVTTIKEARLVMSKP